MTVKTKSIYDLADPKDGKRILVSRYYPRGVKRDRFDLWIREASPKPDLLKTYRNGSIDWREFERRFKEQLRSNKESKLALQDLTRLSKKGTITLLCYEREGQNCHRQILKKKLHGSKIHKRRRGKTNNKSQDAQRK
jgi:uncharacterized protein YeaO (DUF488 family)